MHAVTYICWVWWMPMCKFFKRFSQWELEWALLLAEFLSPGPPCLAPPFCPVELHPYRCPAPHHCWSWAPLLLDHIYPRGSCLGVISCQTYQYVCRGSHILSTSLYCALFLPQSSWLFWWQSTICLSLHLPWLSHTEQVSFLSLLLPLLLPPSVLSTVLKR